MAAKMKFTYKKAGPGMKAAPAKKMAAGDVLTELNISDDGAGTLTVVGTTQAGNPVDISDVATITVSSEDTNLLTVDAPVKTSHGYKVVGPTGTTALDYTATWNDGSKGPFASKLPATIKADPNNVTGIGVVTFGKPV